MPTRSIFIRLHESLECQINPIDVNFHLQKCWTKSDKEWKLSSLRPIRILVVAAHLQDKQSMAGLVVAGVNFGADFWLILINFFLCEGHTLYKTMFLV